MQPSEILKQIKPCDQDKPFVFISYSSLDAQRVWENVLRFQQMGYNVWLDEKNLDKTKASWRADALEAIRDFNCSLLVYYVSRNSLVSQACFSELECTVEDTTQAIHNGPVKFIAVDVEPIDDIIKFKNEVHGELARKKMDKAEKTAQAITLSKCINQFFNSNNEKVRVKAMGQPNRKMDYYEEITASFPDETRIYEPKVEKTEPKTVVKEKTAPQQPVQKPAPAEKKEVPKVIIVEALEAFIQESIPEEQETASKNKIVHATSIVSAAPKAAVTQTPAQPEKREDPKEATGAELYDAWLLFQNAIDRANEVFEKTGNAGFNKFRELTDIQKQNLQKYIARKNYQVATQALLDTTAFKSGKEGILLAEVLPIGFGATLFTTTNTSVEVPLREVVEVRNGEHPGRLEITLHGGKKLNLQFGVYQEGIRALLETFAEANCKRFGLEQNPQAHPASPIDKRAKAGMKGFSLEKVISDANKMLDGYYFGSRFVLIEDASLVQIQKLESVLRKKSGIKMTDVVACQGFGEGKGASGIIITKDRMYGTWGDASYLYRDVTHVEYGFFFLSQMRITYKDQKPKTAYFDEDYFMPVMRFFEACIKQKS